MLASIFGNGTGVLIIAFCMIAMRHLKDSGGGGRMGMGGGSGAWQVWAMRIVIIFMGIGGVALTLVGIGDLVQRWGRSLLGLAGPGWAFILGTILFVFLLAEVCVHWWKNPSRKIAWTAVSLALTATLVSTGPVGQLSAQLRQAGTQYQAQFNSWIRS
jgi:hypothetical protein